MGIDVTHAAVRRVALLAVIGIVAVSCGAKSTTTGSEPGISVAVDTIAAASTTMPETTTPAESTTSAPTTTVATKPAQPAPYWAIPNGMEVAVAATDGLHLLTGNDDRIISPGVFEDVVAEPAGDGWLVQEWPASMFDAGSGDQATPSTIRRIGDDGNDEVVLTAEAGTYLQLHDAGMVDGRATVFYNVNLLRTGFEDPQILDELYALDLVTGESSKITDVGGWEMGVDVRYGGGNLIGMWGSEATVKPWSVDLAGHLDPIDVERAGLATIYSDDPAAPVSLAISADGARLSWVSWNITTDGQFVSQRLVAADTDGSNRREFTLPAGPALVTDIVDQGDYLVAGSGRYGDGGRTPGALVDAETGGMLVLPVEGPAAAWGQWAESPRWAIVSPVAEDVTAEIRALEPQWTGGQLPFEEALADVLVGDDGGGECASTARSFPNYGQGDGPFYVELRQFCDDSVAGSWYEVTIVGPMLDGSLTGGATRRTLCWRGVTPEGVCV